MEKEKIINEILFLLERTNSAFDGSGYTLSEIKEFIKKSSIKISLNDLKMLLKDMEKKALIEERHFDREYNKRIDYSIEPEGVRFIEKIKTLSFSCSAQTKTFINNQNNLLL